MSPNRRLLVAVLIAPLAAIPVSCLWASLVLLLGDAESPGHLFLLLLYLGIVSSYALMLAFGLPVFLLMRWWGRRHWGWYVAPAVVPFLLLFLLDATRQMSGAVPVNQHGLLFSFMLVIYAAVIATLGWWLALGRHSQG